MVLTQGLSRGCSQGFGQDRVHLKTCLGQEMPFQDSSLACCGQDASGPQSVALSAWLPACPAGVTAGSPGPGDRREERCGRCRASLLLLLNSFF